jgi:hypothetical protein
VFLQSTQCFVSIPGRAFRNRTVTNLRFTVKAVLRHGNFPRMELARPQSLMPR